MVLLHLLKQEASFLRKEHQYKLILLKKIRKFASLIQQVACHCIYLLWELKCFPGCLGQRLNNVTTETQPRMRRALGSSIVTLLSILFEEGNGFSHCAQVFTVYVEK